jgi:hypothetical protein
LADTFELIAEIHAAGPQNPRCAQISRGAIKFLELQRRRDMSWRVNGHLRSARRSPKIGLLDTIQGFLQLQNGGVRAAWAVVFYALRCGERQAAFTYARQTHEFDRRVLEALESFVHCDVGQDLPKEQQSSLREYLAREATLKDPDPFKAYVLAILVREGPLPDSRIITTFEDWAWLRLQMFPRDPTAGFQELRREIADSGPWDEITNPFMIGYVRLISADLERAVTAFLHADVQIDESLHLALAMHVQELVGHHELVRHLRFYAKAIFPGNQKAALKYLSLIRDEDARIESLAKVIVGSPNGCEVFEPAVEGAQLGVAPIVEIVGAIEARKVLEEAADAAMAKGDNRLAVRLMGLANNYEGIIFLESRELLQIIEGFQDVSLLVRISEDYEGIRTSGISVQLEIFTMMRTLIGLAYVTELNKRGKWSDAVTELETIDLFPSTRAGLHEYKERLIHAKSPLFEAIPRALLHALKAYAETFKALPTDEAEARHRLKEKADVLILLSGMLNVPQTIQKQALDLDNELQF